MATYIENITQEQINCYLFTDTPFKKGDMDAGWVHWDRCLMLPDHRSVSLTTDVEPRSRVFGSAKKICHLLLIR